VARVLLVTADRDLALVVDLSLARAGYDVEAALPPGALHPRLAQPPPDAVVLEYAPTGGAGEALVAQLRRAWPRCPLLLVAGRRGGVAAAGQLDRVLARAQPASLVRRPVQAYELIATVTRAVHAAHAA
jgi:DNA-binding response OmpR family regulator